MTTQQQWDIATSVGVTAVAVAAARAWETGRDDRLISDPYAESLVKAANVPALGREMVAEGSSLWTEAMTYLGVRSRFFDEFFQHASDQTVRQVVILASGLDARAFRLSWPDGTRLFEVDQPKVLEFKDTVLDGLGVRAQCERHALGIDLRDDWASALTDAGFDPTVPTAWLAEGLLPYLPAAAEQQLLATIDRFSPQGSHVAVECLDRSSSFLAELTDAPEYQQLQEQLGIDIGSLFSAEQRPAPADWLSEQGWTVQRDDPTELATGWGRDLSGISEWIADQSYFLTARR